MRYSPGLSPKIKRFVCKEKHLNTTRWSINPIRIRQMQFAQPARGLFNSLDRCHLKLELQSEFYLFVNLTVL
jgi:hypothetical protein